jgi:Holliday junction resolvase RusA-like endonuclease
VVIEFTVPLPPRPLLRHRYLIRYRGAGRWKVPYIHTHPAEQSEVDKRAFLTLAKPHRPRKPLEGPLQLDLVFIMPRPESWSRAKATAALSGVAWPTGKPDTDNLVKLVQDALNGVFWLDDAQVCVGSQRKVYGASPRTEVRITELAGPKGAATLF